MLGSTRMEAIEYTVEGMACAHCVLSVRKEVGEVPGVRGVEVAS